MHTSFASRPLFLSVDMSMARDTLCGKTCHCPPQICQLELDNSGLGPAPLAFVRRRRFEQMADVSILLSDA